jgi:hypothetical protein
MIELDVGQVKYILKYALLKIVGTMIATLYYPFSHFTGE